MPAIKPVFTEYDVGRAAWKKLHDLAHQRTRDPRDEVRHLVLYALDRALAGEDVELSQARLEALLDDELEPVA